MRERIATPDGKRRYVRAIFATIADRYDFITVLLSYGQDRRWKRRLIELAAPRAGARALDLATGTGDIAFALAARGARVVGLDITLRMIELAQREELDVAPRSAAARTARSTGFSSATCWRCRFRPRSFDIVTTGYGLRNVPDLAAAIDEIGRVLTPGGQLLSLDFNRPSNRRRARRLPRVSHQSSAPRSAGCCTAIPTPIATSRRRSASIPAPRRWRGCSKRAALPEYAAIRSSAD